MIRSGLNRVVRLCLVFLSLSLALAVGSVDAWGEEYTLRLDPDHTTIRFTLGDILHTVNGSFRLKNGEIQFNPATGTASGLVVVDVSSGNTGNKSRDRKMHKEILESAKYPDATFAPSQVSGPPAIKDQESFDVTGTFTLHGTPHTVTLTFLITRDGTTVDTHTHMVIPYVAWGLKNPSTFILRVNDKLDLDIDVVGQLVQARPNQR